MIVAGGGEGFAPFMSCHRVSLRGGGMVLHEIDTCITNLNLLSIRPQKSEFKSLPRRTFLTASLRFDYKQRVQFEERKKRVKFEELVEKLA